jgi:glycosyltransferase involved in cell wall biosynthesis
MTTPSVLYIASASVSDPLIVSQVIRYLERMRPSLSACHLITFERDGSIDFSQTSEELLAAGIHWHPIKAWKRLRSVGFWFDRRCALACAKKIKADEEIDIVHCRSFLAGTLGRKLKSKDVKFLYDMRGLWSLEKRDKGTIRNLWMFRMAHNLERKLFRDADHIVSLTHAGTEHLRESGLAVPIDVIPTCVDLDRFQPQSRNAATLPNCGEQTDNALNVVSAGTLGAGYLAVEMVRFVAVLKSTWPRAAIRILTGSNHDKVIDAAATAGLSASCLSISKVAPECVPRELAQADVGLCFVKPTEAKVASCPTKLGEYLACGLPVVATDGVGDVTDIIERNRVGVIVRHDDESSWPVVVQKLEMLLRDPDLKTRCRRVAEQSFGLENGAKKYLRIYDEMTGLYQPQQRAAA